MHMCRLCSQGHKLYFINNVQITNQISVGSLLFLKLNINVYLRVMSLIIAILLTLLNLLTINLNEVAAMNFQIDFWEVASFALVYVYYEWAL
jgi:hypothetical protein